MYNRHSLLNYDCRIFRNKVILNLNFAQKKTPPGFEPMTFRSRGRNAKTNARTTEAKMWVDTN